MPSTPMRELYGSHGTCPKNIDSIERDGFKVGAGRHGTGAYFWSYSIESEISKKRAKELAQAYFCTKLGKSAQKRKRVRKGNLAKELVIGPVAILEASIKCSNDSFLDLCDSDMRIMLCDFTEQFVNSREYKALSNDEKKAEMSKIADAFVAEVEAMIGHTAIVVAMEADPPKLFIENRLFSADRLTIYSNVVARSHPCYIVRDSKSISIQNIEKIAC